MNRINLFPMSLYTLYNPSFPLGSFSRNYGVIALPIEFVAKQYSVSFMIYYWSFGELQMTINS